MSILVTYFSASGVTAGKAEALAKLKNADLKEIIPVQPYTSADLNWMNKKSRSSVEMKDEKARPAIIKNIDDISIYDDIYVGFPIWWYEAPRIINTFLESYDFTGKKIHLFATSGGSGINKSVSVLKKQYPCVKDGFMLNGAVNARTVK